MKLLYYSFVVGLAGLASCQKEDATPLLTAAFNQPVTLRFQQSAALPNQNTPELTITVKDVNDSRCPSDVICFWAGVVYTNLGIQDQSGASQTLTLSLGGINDTVAPVQANGQQYNIILKEVMPYPKGNDVPKEDKRVVLAIRRQ
ncbi:hypothetical protein GCM10011375_29850 [Hymenobacter qilianensis]|uniref:Uncharacterized protein n=2 Tax=Hymenobacter qilianensis TaxID=1385715 RepID=A0ACB5PUI2_9BACT|nr:hypothetical protein [Hymenobacter qilianensis]QNP51694.1 hypothetical protein H9L05_17245 [Hymenobacter qilianensis]GGF72756.1 hypothetical protein GCM10011375_29850 [Hymenobacter qilianensis]